MAKGRGARNLAALAAVGALGYNLGKGIYKKPGEKLADVENRDIKKEPEVEVNQPKSVTVAAPNLNNQPKPSKSEVQESVFTGPMNPLVNELGETYSTTIPDKVTSRRATRSIVPKATPPAPPVIGAGAGRGSMSGPTADELEEYAKLKRGAGAGRGSMSGPTADELEEYAKLKRGAGAGRGSMSGPSVAEIAAYKEQQRMDRMRSSGGMWAKGGVIKAKKMASGGAVSASRRGDGIAVRGKTKGKIY